MFVYERVIVLSMARQQFRGCLTGRFESLISGLTGVLWAVSGSDGSFALMLDLSQSPNERALFGSQLTSVLFLVTPFDSNWNLAETATSSYAEA